ncbi:GNAT family N-acetyltransferase [Candidatus Woesearchaeota archaeon]|nr:GNAT family N-acetyltransferase [Candidatus Woesearchaeota archaeon]
MKLIEDVKGNESLITGCIKRHGSSPEHNYFHYLDLEEPSGKNVFISFGSWKGLLAQFFPSMNEWVVLGNVLAPENERLDLLVEAAGRLSAKFVVESSDEFRREAAKREGVRVADPRFALYWPVFDFSEWSGDRMEGGVWKKLRNIRNRFARMKKFEIVDSADVPREQLNALVMEWVMRRKQKGLDISRRGNNKAFYHRYLNMVESGFKGFGHAKTMIVDGEPCSIMAGWDIPNSEGGYYSSVGIYSYKHEGLGEFANMHDLSMIKECGYRFVDFGGSPKPLLDYKLKFRPTSIYKTCTFVLQSPNPLVIGPIQV